MSSYTAHAAQLRIFKSTSPQAILDSSSREEGTAPFSQSFPLLKGDTSMKGRVQDFTGFLTAHQITPFCFFQSTPAEGI
jgi:hypothetical protein